MNKNGEPPNKKPKIEVSSSLSEVDPTTKTSQSGQTNRLCPYLDTINRQYLDFDFEKLCSVSLTRINVYACLVCGKYFQGRGTNTHAYTHSVAESHHVYLNLNTLKFYCLPDNYEIIDSSLDDIKYVLNPTFTESHIQSLDASTKMSRAIDGSLYMPGIVGLNNIKANDYCNVILQALSHVASLRDYFLREENYSKVKRPPGDSAYTLVQRFGELMRKLWNPRNFKVHVSPHEMLQAVVLWSRKQFQFTQQGDPIDFLSWFLNALHRTLNGTKKPNSSIIHKSFLGSMNIYTRKIPPTELDDKQKRHLLTTPEYQEVLTESPFLYLTCDLPPQPLFMDELSEKIIPQVNLYQLLTKFNGKTEREYRTYKENLMKRFEITRLPPYLILYIKRFTKNTFFLEKNPTIVNFPVKNVDFAELLTSEVKAKHKSTTYDLIANIVHDGEPNKGTYKVHILQKSTVTSNPSSSVDPIINPLHLKIADRILEFSLVSLGVKLTEKVCERAKKNNPLMNWAINFGEHSVKLAIDKAVLLPNFVQQPIKSVDKLLCSGMDLIAERAGYINNVYVHPLTENKLSMVLINSLEGMLTSGEECVNKYLPADILDIDEIQPREKLNKALFHVVVFASKIAFTLVIASINERPLLQSHIAELLQELVNYTERVAGDPAVIVELSKNLWTTLSSNQLQYLKRIDNYKDLIEIVTFEVAKLIVHFIQNVIVSPLESLPTSIAKFSESLKTVLEHEVTQVVPLSAL